MKRELGNLRIFVFPLILLLFLFTAVRASAESVEERIKALEEAQRANAEELARLKGEQEQTKAEQMELKKEALAARDALPSFDYRPGSGLRITAADKEWRIRFYGRQMTYMSFFDDNESRGGLSQGAVHVRRFRPGFNFEFYKRFVEWRFQLNLENGGDGDGGVFTEQDAEMYVHFERLNPWLPKIGFGGSPSFDINPADTNCSSRRCGRSERSFVNEGIGVTTGSVERGIVTYWEDLPLFGPARLSFLNVGFGLDGSNNFDEGEDLFENDSKSVSWGIGIEPFKNLKNKWLRGIELSFGGRAKKQFEAGEGVNIRANQIRFERVEFIRSEDLAGQEQYYSPGVNWKIGPYTLRAAGQFWNGHLEKAGAATFGDTEIGEEGGLIQARGFRILHELWLWSPKEGWFTGDPREGGLMIAPMYQRADVDAPSGGLEDCGGCKSAHATNAGVALWYYFGQRVMNVGVVWDHWRVANAHGDDEGAATLIEGGRGPGGGGTVNFNSVTFVSRFHW